MGVETRAHLVCSAKTGKIAENSWYTAPICYLVSRVIQRHGIPYTLSTHGR